MCFPNIRMGKCHRRNFGNPVHRRVVLGSDITILVPALVLLFMIAPEVGVAEEFPSSRLGIASESKVLLRVERSTKCKIFGALEVAKSLQHSSPIRPDSPYA